MRIISQDKMRDISYESCALQIRNDNQIVGFCANYLIDLGHYNKVEDAKAVLWDIAANFKVGKDYYEMPQDDEDLSYAYREV